MIQEFEKENDDAGADSIRLVWKDEILYLESWLKKIESPSMIKIPCTGNMMIVIPKGAKQPHQTTWSLEGYSAAMKESLANEVPGGEPAYIYRRSTTDDGYETMKNDLQQFFYLDGKDKSHRYKGFRAIERIDTEEQSFLHLYDGTTTILIYDSRTERYCQMEIIVGGIELFNEAVNDISINGDNGYATRCNIIICDGGIDFTNEEIEINGVTHDSGVHFTTGYMEKLK